MSNIGSHITLTLKLAWCVLMQDFRDSKWKIKHTDVWLPHTWIWCIACMDYIYGALSSFWSLTVAVPVSSFVFVEARKWCGFGRTWEWVNDDADLYFWINYSYKISHLINFGIFLEPRVEVTWRFFSCVCFFKLRSYLHNYMNFLFHNVCLDKKKSGTRSVFSDSQTL